jgi:hypothetical protein
MYSKFGDGIRSRLVLEPNETIGKLAQVWRYYTGTLFISDSYRNSIYYFRKKASCPHGRIDDYYVVLSKPEWKIQALTEDIVDESSHKRHDASWSIIDTTFLSQSGVIFREKTLVKHGIGILREV